MNSKVLIAQSFLAIALLASFASSEHVFWKTFREMHRGLKVEPSSTRDAALVEEKWITQKVDHFNEEDTRTWQMRYLENAEQYESGGPLFILVAGEWSVTTDVMTGGHIYGMVKEHKGLYFYAEHRFYGKSQPMSDFTTESLKYLDMKQILADLAHFITTIKATYPGASNSKVFLAGGSYSAAVVAWFKHDYPELADAVWSSSTPIITKFIFVEYKEYEGESIRRVGGEQCYNAIDNATRTYEQMFRENRGAEVRAMLKICNDFDETNELDYYSFFSTISSVFSNIVQTQNPQNGNIQAACRAITSHETPAVGLAKFLLYIWTRIGSLQTCNQMSYASMVRGLSSTKLSMDISRPWFYQLCSQCGWFQTSGNRNQPYGIFPEELYLNLCADVYGPHLTRDYIYKAIGEMSAHYGDENIKADHVYYTNGDVDAIVAMSIKDPAKMTLLPGYSHCSDFESISSRDTPEMVASKQKIAQLVREWFAE